MSKRSARRTRSCVTGSARLRLRWNLLTEGRRKKRTWCRAAQISVYQQENPSTLFVEGFNKNDNGVCGTAFELFSRTIQDGNDIARVSPRVSLDEDTLCFQNTLSLQRFTTVLRPLRLPTPFGFVLPPATKGRPVGSTRSLPLALRPSRADHGLGWGENRSPNDL